MGRRRSQRQRLFDMLSNQVEPEEFIATLESLSESSRQAALETMDGEGQSLTHRAVSTGNMACLAYLIDIGALKMHARQQYAQTPLHVAAMHGNLEAVTLLLTQGQVLVDCHTTRGRTPLMYAARNGHCGVLRMLLQHGAQVNERTKTGICALYEACREGQVCAVELLLRRSDIQINLATQIQHTPLHAACGQGHVEVVALLLAHGDLNLNVKDVNDVTVYHEIAGIGNTELFDLVYAQAAGQILFHQLEPMGDKILARHPFHYAAVEGHAGFIQHLLDHIRVDVNMVDRDQCTAIYYAAANGHKEVLEVLLRAGADPNVCSIRRSPLHCAIEWNRLDCILLLLEHGAQVDITDQDGQTAAACAMKKYHTTIATETTLEASTKARWKKIFQILHEVNVV